MFMVLLTSLFPMAVIGEVADPVDNDGKPGLTTMQLQMPTRIKRRLAKLRGKGVRSRELNLFTDHSLLCQISDYVCAT